MSKQRYTAGDQINDLLCLPIVEGSWVGRGLTVAVAVNDRTIRVLDAAATAALTVVYDVKVTSPPITLCLWKNTGDASGSRVLFGCRDGAIGLVDLPAGKSGRLEWERVATQGGAGWRLCNEKQFVNEAVNALSFYDMTKDGRPELITGRDDGLIELYTITDTDTLEPLQTFVSDSHSFRNNFIAIKSVDESITSLDCGRVGNTNYVEIVASTYTGWLIGVTTEPPRQAARAAVAVMMPVDSSSGHIAVTPDISSADSAKVRQMKLDIDELQRRVGEQRDRYHEQTSLEAVSERQSSHYFSSRMA